MTQRIVQIKLETGLQARAIALLVQEASKYESVIHIQAGMKTVNAKSIMGMMSLSVDNGEELVVSANGEDEQNAVEGIERFLSGQAV